MNCFVIMPFAPEFDDVYRTIQGAVVEEIGPGCHCHRLDETRAAGRLTDRLVTELKAASLCVVDLTEARPNVMWETGYVMALGCPVIFITQNLQEMPFDIRDMQTIEYERIRLGTTLAPSLRRAVSDTINAKGTKQPTDDARLELIGQLKDEMSQLKSMVSQIVNTWPVPQKVDLASASLSLRRLQGNWLSTESGSYVYSRLINDELVAPYCYSGNSLLTGVYYGWKKTGDFWFARYKWVVRPLSGFSFLKETSLDSLSGAWWFDDEVLELPNSPPQQQGVPATWQRLHTQKLPHWASEFLNRAEQVGLDKLLEKPSGKR